MISTATRSATNLTRLQRRRLSWRIAKGMPFGKAAGQSGLDEPAADDLLADGHFSLLVEAYQALADLPEDARRRRLLQLAIRVIEEATINFDMRVALFVMRQETLGRDAAEVLADGVIRSLERREPQRRTPDDTSPTPQPPPESCEPSCPVDNAIYRAAASLRSDVMDEFELETAVAMAGPFHHVPVPRRDDRPPQQAEPVTVRERAEAEPDPPAGPAEDEKPGKSADATVQKNFPSIRADRLTGRQLQYLADLAIRRSRATGPPVEIGPDDPNEPTTT
jgi:hypothetical protein